MTDAASSTEVDSVYMRRALALARLGWGQTAPNPMVGAVVVAGGIVVGEGHHARYGGPHAEVVALDAAGARARGATMYVTLEPCAHYGKTPPCVDAVIAAGISRVVIAVRDPSDIARGGVERLRAQGIQVDVGTESAAALELNAPFFNAHASDRPWVTLKLALSADGGVADPTGSVRWITGPESRREVHRLRADADAIAVGIGTLLADDPSLTVRDAPAPRVQPRRIVFDSTLRTPLGSAIVQSARTVPTTIVCRAGAPEAAKGALEAAGVDVRVANSIEEALRALRAEDIRSLFLECGPRLAGSFLGQSLVDRLIIFRAPVVLGEGSPRAFAYAPAGFEESLGRSRILEEQRFGDDVMTTYALKDVPCLPD
ncbi:MAG TPA: bifunctional diaminohydroxyphosphoribosylaminopyrimidine deaminase/5-amino-6-(5-phosphoribosylamino)uracil reductase RibD [Gemmatimonadaceae bacterium]|jgi:diaminohydroxyphosphoribosylaminopyrimidine deaminase/5-amino-6-(5-phosphoribosylamino)uracil reductase